MVVCSVVSATVTCVSTWAKAVPCVADSVLLVRPHLKNTFRSEHK